MYCSAAPDHNTLAYQQNIGIFESFHVDGTGSLPAMISEAHKSCPVKSACNHSDCASSREMTLQITTVPPVVHFHLARFDSKGQNIASYADDPDEICIETTSGTLQRRILSAVIAHHGHSCTYIE